MCRDCLLVQYCMQLFIITVLTVDKDTDSDEQLDEPISCPRGGADPTVHPIGPPACSKEQRTDQDSR